MTCFSRLDTSYRNCVTVVFPALIVLMFAQFATAQPSPAVFPSTRVLAEGPGGLGDWNRVIEAEMHRALRDREQLLAAVDWFSNENQPIGVIGHGEGGMLTRSTSRAR